ncbi:MAG: glucose 1-dehydrogenase [Myxococcales bacterium]|nr:glucose 1-dehydrogenase [Myxococcales bacterium]MCB9643542.1 glucose 1-dehydrogenase [Myxococcales bacterium]
MADRLKGKVAIVTGGSRGIGEAIARSFASEGAKVVIASRKLEGLEGVAASINAEFPGAVFAKACHIGKSEEISALVDWTEKEVGLPNVLVNNAATNPYLGPMLMTPEAAWDKTFDVNLKGYFSAIREVSSRLLERDQPGSIINMSSIFGMGAAPLQGVYGMTKAAIISMTQTLAAELGQAKIRVNAVAPGLVDTHFAAAIVQDDTMREHFTSRAPLARYALPQEISGMVVFLASDESSFVTGQTFPVDGGYTVS